VDAINLFARNFVRIDYEDLPQNVIEITKREVLDLLGVTVAGYASPGVRELADLIVEWGGKEESSIVYYKKKVPAPMAAQANATMGHSLDFDDVHDLAVMHPAVPVVSACLAVAESLGNVSGTEFITAVALGVDMICRLALATWPGYDPTIPESKNIAFQAERVKHGWHLTTLMGYLASAGAAGKLLGLDEEQMVNAFGIAFHQCSGSHQGRDDGAHTKRLGPGFSARAGVSSSLMAQRGITGTRNTLEGHFGLYKIYFQGGYDRETLIAGLGRHFEGINVSFKPYPCCRGIHPHIDATLELANATGINLEDVKEIKVFADAGGYQMLCSPLKVKKNPRTPVDAQFSIPWGVATALARRRVGIEHFTRSAIESSDIREAASKIIVVLDHCLDTSDKIPTGKVEIETNAGQVYRSKVDYPLGSPERPMTFDECAKKFRSCAAYPTPALDDSHIERVIELIGQMELLDDVGEINRLLTL
jgi:2-methylcitrate dehydratase PrpD